MRHFHGRCQLPDLIHKFPKLRLASIGPETTKTLESLGMKAAVEAKPHTIDGLVAALSKAVRPGK